MGFWESLGPERSPGVVGRGVEWGGSRRVLPSALFLVIKSKLCSNVSLSDVVSLCLPNDKLLMNTCYNANESGIHM